MIRRTGPRTVAACRALAAGGTFGMRRYLKAMRSPQNLCRVLAAIAAGVSLGLCGCVMQPTIAASVMTADGQRVDVPLNDGLVPVADEAIEVKSLQFSPWDMGPDKPKNMAFSFIVEFKNGAKPSTIEIDDVTEPPVLRIYEDFHAHIVKNNIWGAVSRPFAPQDEHVNWVLTLDNNVRIYRFTVKLEDGTLHKLYKPVFVPGNMKEFVRGQLGIK
jgi:hypothetical protein